MQRVHASLSYDGTEFHGYQRQKNSRSVQEEIEKVLKVIHKANAWRSTSSGRTDAGVHALNQSVHFDTPLALPEDRWARALNSILPEDIYVNSCQFVEDKFHARYDALGKEYIYKLNTSVIPNVFQRNFVHHLRGKLDGKAMRVAADELIGTHDFTSFSSPKTAVIDKVRTLFTLNIHQEGDDWTFQFIGSGFLYQMVRILMGTLIIVGMGKKNPTEVKKILEKCDRSVGGPTAPSCGLYLSKVFYTQEELNEYLGKSSRKI